MLLLMLRALLHPAPHPRLPMALPRLGPPPVVGHGMQRNTPPLPPPTSALVVPSRPILIAILLLCIASLRPGVLLRRLSASTLMQGRHCCLLLLS